MFRQFAIAALFFLGLWWCYEVIHRFPKDVKEIYEQKEAARTVAIIFIWALTVVIAILLIRYSFKIIDELGKWISWLS